MSLSGFSCITGASRPRGDVDVFSFGKFAHEKRLAKALRRRPLEPDALEALKAALTDHHRFRELPIDLLCKL